MVSLTLNHRLQAVTPSGVVKYDSTLNNIYPEGVTTISRGFERSAHPRSAISDTPTPTARRRTQTLRLPIGVDDRSEFKPVVSLTLNHRLQAVTPAGVCRSLSRYLLPVLVLCILCLTGCGIDNIDDDGFGRVRSTSGYGAIDGISGFVHLLKSRGLNVRQTSRISPQIERYDTIIWAPNRDVPPSDAAIERLNRWIENGRGDRQVIFIGPGFRSRKLLDKKQIELADDESLERAVRRYQEKLIQGNFRRGAHYWIGSGDGQECDWYQLTEIEDDRINKISGPWAATVSADELELYSGIYDFEIPADLKPAAAAGPGDSDEDSVDNQDAHDGRAVVLLSGDGHNLVYRIPSNPNHSAYYGYDDDYDQNLESGVYIIANGSFLQNYGLVNRGNQQLANKVADVCRGEVLVLQSGPQPIEVTESLAPEKNGWAWLSKRPLRDIVPFFLLLATFTFFVVFPIHGRPKRIRLHPEKTFADHIRATGQLLKASKGRDWAKKVMQKHLDGSSDKPSGR